MATYGIWRDVVIGSGYGAITWGNFGIGKGEADFGGKVDAGWPRLDGEPHCPSCRSSDGEPHYQG